MVLESVEDRIGAVVLEFGLWATGEFIPAGGVDEREEGLESSTSTSGSLKPFHVEAAEAAEAALEIFRPERLLFECKLAKVRSVCRFLPFEALGMMTIDLNKRSDY